MKTDLDSRTNAFTVHCAVRVNQLCCREHYLFSVCHVDREIRLKKQKKKPGSDFIYFFTLPHVIPNM